jgi:hypothetical protein
MENSTAPAQHQLVNSNSPEEAPDLIRRAGGLGEITNAHSPHYQPVQSHGGRRRFEEELDWSGVGA